MARLVDDLPTVCLAVAEVQLSAKPVYLQTVLGSCVSATLWSPRLGIGAMCHGALPCCPEKMLRGSDLKARLRYVDYAICYLIDRLCSAGARRSELQAKLFGGADVLPIASVRARESVGRKNSAAAISTLEREGVGLATSDLGGRQGRVIYFRTDTGEVLLKRLSASDLATVDEADLIEELRKAESYR